MARRFYWLKLSENFFDERYIKALRRLPQGDSLAIVYLKMQLSSLKTEGIIKYEHILPDSAAELALALDEEENIVKLALSALISYGVVERWDDETLYMSAMQHMIGSEGESAARVRRHRELKKFANNSDVKALQSNGCVTDSNTEKDIEREKEKREEIEKEIKSLFSPVVDYLNMKAGTSYKDTSKKTQSLIHARAAEGFKLDDFKRVIDNMCAAWINDPKMEQYLRPETLFGTKFEGYLNSRQHNAARQQRNDPDDLDGIL